MKKLILGAVAVLVPLAPIAGSAQATGEDGERRVLLGAATENSEDDTATLPIAKGVDEDGQEFWYVITEASNQKTARDLNVNTSKKLGNARDTGAVQQGRFVDGVLTVEATVDFSPERVVVPDPVIGFPPLAAAPGSIGEVGYSPLVQLPNGVVLNAPHIANDTGIHDKVVGALDETNREATFQETEGFYDGKEIYYISFDVSNPDVAALEAATYAPELNDAPGLGSNTNKSARSAIVPFVNGQTGVDNPNRQGLNSALLGDGDPLNVTQTLAGQREYSPLWDVHPAIWTDEAIAQGLNTLQVDFDDIEDIAEDGFIIGPSGSFEAGGFIVNCPIISVVD